MRALIIASLLLGAITLPRAASAQTGGCGGDYLGCTSAPIHYAHREALPGKFNFDTDWVPSGSPVQVRIQAVFAGNTQVALDGALVGSWPTPMSLTTTPTPGGGTLSVDYGIVLNARVRLDLNLGLTHAHFEGDIPYVPMIDFRAMSSSTFEPWAWTRQTAHGITARQHIAMVPLTDAIVHIPGVSGGFALDASGEVTAGYNSTRFTFGTQADPITATMLRTQAMFTAGPFVEYQPVLEGSLDYTVGVQLYPSLYVSLAGHNWTIGLPTIPIDLGPFPHDITFDPATARLGLPVITDDATMLDFGEVALGQSVERTLALRNDGEGDGRLLSLTGDGPFTAPASARPLPAHSRSSVVITFAPVRPGVADGTFEVNTNDPVHPHLLVAVRGVGIGPAVVDAGAVVEVDAGEDGGVSAPATGTDDGGCGCAVAGRRGNVRGGMAALLAIGVWGAARRARRGSAARRKAEKRP